MYEIFETCGEIVYVRTLRDDKGCKGIAYVCFKTIEAVQLALGLNGTLLDDRPIRCQRYLANKKDIDKIKKEKALKTKAKSKKFEKKSPKKSKIVKKNSQETGKNVDADNAKKVKSAFQGKKIERTKKVITKLILKNIQFIKSFEFQKRKLGQGERMKKKLAQKLIPRDEKAAIA